MGVLDKLMFWKSDSDELQHVEGYEVDGCFTLPETELADEPLNACSEPTPDPIPE